MFYTVCYFGSPRTRVPQPFSGKNALGRARKAASEAKGTGSCQAARVYECASLDLARSADISEVRDGERVVFSA